MELIYEWLYDHYAEPRLRELPEFREDLVDRLAEELVPEEQRLCLLDRLAALQVDQCTAAFEMGVRLGLALSAGQNTRPLPL